MQKFYPKIHCLPQEKGLRPNAPIISIKYWVTAETNYIKQNFQNIIPIPNTNILQTERKYPKALINRFLIMF